MREFCDFRFEICQNFSPDEMHSGSACSGRVHFVHDFYDIWLTRRIVTRFLW
jgi:hypothetical protein